MAAFSFPQPSLHKGAHTYAVSSSRLKTAVITQLDQFWDRGYPKTKENIAASFQKAAILMLTKRVEKLLQDTGISRLAAGGGVAANSLLRQELQKLEGVEVRFPSPQLCTDNAAMVAGIGYHYIRDGITSGMDLNATARVPIFRKAYP
jgi:N6-L-threonylcarbamoyladenine synthase